KIRSKKRGNLIVSSATANPKSRRVHLFRELLGFEVGRPSVSLRNIDDIYEEPQSLYETSVERVRSFGKGGLVFLPGNKTKEELYEFVAYLQSRGIAAQSYEEFDEEAFRAGDVEVVVGFASYRNPLARGLDMPDTIRYALFVGVPKMEFRLDLQNHVALYYFVLALRKALPQVSEWIGYLERLRFIPPDSLLPQAKERIEDIKERLLALLAQEEDKINSDPDISLLKEGDTYKVVTADVTGYIQASGRTSRLYAGGLTKGLAYTLVDSQKAFASLQKKVRWFSDEIVFRSKDEVDIEAILRQIDEDRRKVKEALSGRVEGVDPFTTTLVVVESPNKARTIANFYGKPMIREIGGVRVYEVAKEDRMLSIAASKGHLFDLSTDVGFDGVLVEPKFIEVFEPIDEDRFTIAKVLRELDLEESEIFIATDPDTEGEKISYDIYLNSLPFNHRIQRAEFHEVTRRAFDEAIDNPRDFDEDLVRAQLVRRVADRWIGFEVSKYLQKRFGKKSLSAGRVQSAVLEWIVLREYEARQEVWVVVVDVGVEAEFVFEKEQEAREFYERLGSIHVHYEKKERKKLFETPFSTDRMLYAASKKLRLTPQRAMELAQDLFEAGFITYHRTDSIRVSSAGIGVAKEYIVERFGEEYFVPRTFASSGGAHEAIRPTRAMDREDLEEFLRLSGRELLEDHLKLYDLIFRTFIASQMKEAVAEEIEAVIKALAKEARVRFLSRIVEHGIDLIVPIETKEVPEGEIEAKKELMRRPKVPRYSYAEIVRMMKERGVGRPSTYAITIEKLQQRRYIYQKGGVIYATKLGIEVYEELRSNPAIYAFVNERYTRELEALMDRVEKAEAKFEEVLQELYEKIQKEIHENTL
ncbi:MAG: reverse gyrase, partial [Epsilonproteobacteria bacterium]|nr:reverse gyrase [Campylobacterota bacterium]NPA63975.1 reverse gyrase [Campylobacterota bacterium]